MTLGKARQPVLVAFLIGLVTGIPNGLLGVGGGTILVPALVLWMGFQQRHAHATALAVILPTAAVSSILYVRGGYFAWELAWPAAIGLMLGSYLGARLLNRLPAPVLRKLFGVIMVLAAARMAF